MKFFIAERIQKHLDEKTAAEWLPRHGAFMDKGVEEGAILLAGPKTESEGGFAVIRAKSKSEAEDYLFEDPMVKAGLQRYELTEIMPLSCRKQLADWCGE